MLDVTILDVHDCIGESLSELSNLGIRVRGVKRNGILLRKKKKMKKIKTKQVET